MLLLQHQFVITSDISRFCGVHCGALCWDTVLQARRSWVLFPLVSMNVVMGIFLPAALWPWGWLGLKRKWVTGIFRRGQRQPVPRAENITTFVCRLTWNLGAWTFWNPLGLSRPVMGLLYLSPVFVNPYVPMHFDTVQCNAVFLHVILELCGYIMDQC